MRFTSRTPAPPLSALVRRLWDWQGEEQPFRLERVLPPAGAGASVILNLGEDQSRLYDEQRRCQVHAAHALEGPRSRSQIIDTREQVAVMGIEFQPGGAAVFFRERMDVLRDGCVDLQDLMGARDAALRDALLAATSPDARLQALEGWLRTSGYTGIVPLDVAHALRALDARPEVAALVPLARDMGISARRLGERFQHWIGLSPKRYLRLQRFHHAVRSARPPADEGWADMAVACGFYDQAHLVHEFRAFSGMSPGEFARRGAWDGHVAGD